MGYQQLLGVGQPMATSSPFAPTDLSGLVSWYDAQNAGSITQLGGAVSQWNDLSASAKNLVQANATLQPAYTTLLWGGGKASVNFLGTQTIAAGPANGPISSYADFTFFAEFDFQSTGNYQGITVLDNSGRFAIYIDPSNNVNFLAPTASPGSVASTTALSNGHHYICVKRDATGLLSFRIDGVDDVTTATLTPSTITLTASTNYFLACDNNPLPLASLMAEAFLYNNIKNSTEIGQCETYLTGRW